ncbi:MAG: alkaline phosphatase family protein [Chloroflexota bacterium]
MLIVLDGSRPDYFTVPGIPHVKALIRNGTTFRNAFAGILESETPAGHATIGTGSEPKGDGILSFAWATSENTSINLFSQTKINDGDMERIMKKAGASSIASLVHKQSPGAQVVALSGSKYYAADAIGGPDANVIMYYTGTPDGRFVPTAVPGHSPPPGVLSTPGLSLKSSHHIPHGLEDHLAMRLALTTFSKLHQKVTLINEPEFDWPLGHVDGADADPAMVKTLMHQFDKDLASMENAYRKAGILNQTLFVLTADHGFATISHRVNDQPIRKAVLAAGSKMISHTFHTADYIWLQNPKVANVAAKNVAKLQNPYIQAVYFKEHTSTGYQYIRATGSNLFRVPGMENANQYLLNSFDGGNGPDIVVMYTEQSASSPGGQASWKGDHGGGAWESQHVPLFISGPGVRKGVTSWFPAQLMDVAPTALDLMGISSQGMHGHALVGALTKSTKAQQTAGTAEGNQLYPVIRSLKAESTADLKAGR